MYSRSIRNGYPGIEWREPQHVDSSNLLIVNNYRDRNS
jgi:hypothetical protein